MEIYQKAFYKNLDTRERVLYHTIKHMNKCSYVCNKITIRIKSKRSLGKKMERKEKTIIQDIECCEVEEVHEDKVRMISAASCSPCLRRISVYVISQPPST